MQAFLNSLSLKLHKCYIKLKTNKEEKKKEVVIFQKCTSSGLLINPDRPSNRFLKKMHNQTFLCQTNTSTKNILKDK